MKDYGIGIAKEDQMKIFDRFGRVAPITHYGGLGLGLYICKQIIELHGGKITVESIPGTGATFRVELPRSG
jgi:signal transduction histidine kinase